MKRFISIILLLVYLGIFVMIGIAMIPKPQKRNYAPIIERNMLIILAENKTEETTQEVEIEMEFEEPIETTEVITETTNTETTEQIIEEETSSNIYNNDFVDNTYSEVPESNYRVLYVTAYAYCPCMKCCGKTNGITATGTQATEGRTIAVDPTVIPYGSKVLIDNKVYIAEDCGGFRGNVIDVFHNTHEKALQFGRKNIEIIIYQ